MRAWPVDQFLQSVPDAAKRWPVMLAQPANPGMGDSRPYLAGMGQTLLLVMLAIAALAISSAFFYRMERHAADGRPDLLPGVTLINAAPPESGVIVTSLRSDGDAAHGGMAVGDAVVSIDGTPIHSLDQASHYLIGTHRPMVTIGLVRGDHRLAIALDRSRT